MSPLNQYVTWTVVLLLFLIGTASAHVSPNRPTQPKPSGTEPSALRQSATASELQHRHVVQPINKAHFKRSTTDAMAALTSITYCKNRSSILDWSCSRCQRFDNVADFQPYRLLRDTAFDLFGYVGYLPGLHGIVVAIRGTDSSNIYSWVTSLKVGMTDFPGVPGGKVHAGFYAAWSKSTFSAQVSSALTELLQQHPGAHVYLAGHSLGGALATIAAIHLALPPHQHATPVRRLLSAPPPAAPLPGKNISLITLGSPRLANCALAKAAVHGLGESWRVTHGRDIVPSLPALLMGYHHLAAEVWEHAGELKRCDASGEDVTCQMGACLLGLCTSVEDHLLYLGYAMESTGC